MPPERYRSTHAASSYLVPLDPEDVPEFHAARLLLVMHICGTSGTISGRTKLAKLDFFVRYPRFLEAGLAALRGRGVDVEAYAAGVEGVEASMVRYRYGPWDFRYRDIVSMLTSRDLVSVRQAERREDYSMTASGRAAVGQLLTFSEMEPVIRRCELVGAAFGSWSGSQLKEFIYEAFAGELVPLPLGSEIDDLRR